MNKLVLLGAPGAGKGTQAELLSDKLGIPVISTGNILKKAVREQTALGLEAANYINEGKLVPDETILNILKQRLASPDCENGYILDGVPRTLVQAEVMDEMGVELTAVISLEVDDLSIEERMGGRRICSKCGSSYHMAAKRPQTEGICDRCGGELVIREDDRPEIVKARLVTYHEMTEPLISFYEAKGILKKIDGEQGVFETMSCILESLGVQ